MCEGHAITGFFYNPNIHPVDEYEKRLKTAQKVSDQLGFDLIEAGYDRQRWFEIVKGTENELEGGARCERCFRLRLGKSRIAHGV